MFSLLKKACFLYKRSKIVFSLYIFAISHMGIQGLTGGYKGLRGIRGGYKGSQGVTRGYMVFHMVTRGHKG